MKTKLNFYKNLLREPPHLTLTQMGLQREKVRSTHVQYAHMCAGMWISRNASKFYRISKKQMLASFL